MDEAQTQGFGPTLRAARQAAGRGIDDLAAATRIQPRYLEALEAEEWDAVPSGVIGRGFVRLLAKELGLPAGDFLERYRQARLGADPRAPLAPPEPEWRVDLRREPSARPVLLALLLLAGAALGIWVWSPWSVELPPAPQEDAATPSPAPSPAPSPSPVPEPVPGPPAEAAPPPAVPAAELAPAPPPPAPGLHRLEILAVEKVWVRVTADGSPAEERLLQPGATLSYEVRREASLRLGNAGGVILRWDGQALKAPGAPGQVLTLVLPQALEALRP